MIDRLIDLPIISKSAGAIFDKFSALAELRLPTISLKLLLGPSSDVAMATDFRCWLYPHNGVPADGTGVR